MNFFQMALFTELILAILEIGTFNADFRLIPFAAIEIYNGVDIEGHSIGILVSGLPLDEVANRDCRGVTFSGDNLYPRFAPVTVDYP
jgi:hypothetical protein